MLAYDAVNDLDGFNLTIVGINNPQYGATSGEIALYILDNE